jgi:hypothetical protein
VCVGVGVGKRVSAIGGGAWEFLLIEGDIDAWWCGVVVAMLSESAVLQVSRKRRSKPDVNFGDVTDCVDIGKIDRK